MHYNLVQTSNYKQVLASLADSLFQTFQSALVKHFAQLLSPPLPQNKAAQKSHVALLNQTQLEVQDSLAKLQHKLAKQQELNNVKSGALPRKEEVLAYVQNMFLGKQQKSQFEIKI